MKKWYDDSSDYNTNAKSYYDYLARTNKLLKYIQDIINNLLRRDVNTKNTKSVSITKSDSWEEQDVFTLQADVNVSKQLDNQLTLENDGLYVKPTLQQTNEGSFFDRIKYKRLIAKGNTREPLGDTRFPQSAVIIHELNRYFVYRQTGSESNDQTIYEYNLTTNELVNSKPINMYIGTRVYMEGFIYKIDNNQIKFIIPTGQREVANGYYGGKYGVFNYTTGQLERTFELPNTNYKYGFNSDFTQAVFTTTEINPDTGYITSPYSSSKGFAIYDYNSLFTGTPKLIKEIIIPHDNLVKPEKIQGVTLYNNFIVSVHGSNKSVVKFWNDEGLLHYTETLSNKDVLAKFMDKQDGTEETTIESEGVSWYKDNNGVHLVNYITGNSKGIFLEYGSLDVDNRVELKTKMTTTTSWWNDSESVPYMRMMNKNGSPKITLTKPTDDFYKVVPELNQAGFYTVVIGSEAVLPKGIEATATGWVYCRSTSETVVINDNDEEVVTRKVNRASFYLSDFRGHVISGYFDDNANPKWTETNQLTTNTSITGTLPTTGKLTEYTRKGQYQFSAGISRQITDLPKSYTSFGSYLEVMGAYNNSYIIQRVRRLNTGVGSGGNLQIHERLLYNGNPCVSNYTDENGWRSIDTGTSGSTNIVSSGVNISSDSTVRVTAHRGLSKLYPENTLKAFKMAKANGYNEIEVDIKFTSDNIPVILHDSTINRTARNDDGSVIVDTIAIKDITLSQAKTYDFGVWKGIEHNGELIPTFEETLCLAKLLGCKVHVDKLYQLTEAQMVVCTNLVKKHKMEKQVIFYIATNQQATIFRRELENCELFVALFSDVTQEGLDLGLSFNTPQAKCWVSPDASKTTESGVQLATSQGINVWAWNSEAKELITLVSWGVTGVHRNGNLI